MSTNLKKLFNWLIMHGLNKEAQQIDELEEENPWLTNNPWDEDWNEEAVKEFGSEPISEKEYVEQNFLGTEEDLIDPTGEIDEFNIDILKKIADQEDIQILQSGSAPTILGNGAYGIVISGIYQNKPVAAKIIYETDENDKYKPSNEGSNWKKILAASKVNSQLQKYLPQVYKINKGQVEYSTVMNDYTLDYEIIIMEKLFPLTEQLKDVYYLASQQTHIPTLLKDQEYVYQISQEIAKLINKVKQYYKLNINEEITGLDIMQVIMNIKDLPQKSPKDISRAVVNYIERNYISRKKTRKTPFINSAAGADLNDWIIEIIRKFLSPEKLPTHYQDKVDPFWENIPETQGFYKALKTLADDFGIKWQDIHRNNVMTDRSGNLKLIDPGLFSTQDFIVPDSLSTKTL